MSNRRSELRDILSRHELLGLLPAKDLDRLVEVSPIRSYGTAETIFVKGDLGDFMVVVLTGRIRISSNTVDGREVVLAMLGPYQMIGEIAVIDGGERTADAVALEPTEVLVLTQREFVPCLKRSPEACWALLMIIAERLRRTDEQLEDMGLPLKARLAKRLLFLMEHYGEPNNSGIRITIPLPQHLLASMVGTTREAVNKQLGTWQQSNLISVKRGTVNVLDCGALEDIVGEE
ncbi:MAG: Crp/Fnr family transcriptional regulator [Rhodospirillales bacterium]|nr:Crp/Fnr family transcriptional regulator [Rhodospirillales bacterium]